MKLAVRFLYIVFALISVAGLGQSFAAEPSGLQKRELILLIEDLNRAVANGDIDVLVDAMPPRLYEGLARIMQTDVEALRSQFKELAGKQFPLSILGYKYDKTDIDYNQAEDGTFYALVSTSAETSELSTTFKTLALYEDSKWHMIYGGQSMLQNSAFLEIYPFFAGIHLLPAERIKK